MHNRSTWPLLEAANEAELLAHIGTSTLVESYRGPDVTWAISGVDSNDYNGVVWARFSGAAARQQVPQIVRRFQERGLPALWHIDPASTPTDLPQQLEALGCRQLAPGVGMAADLAALPTAPLVAGLVIERVRDAAALAAWMDVWAHDEPDDRLRRERISADLGFADDQPLRQYLARLHGQPVGISQVFLGQHAAGLYSVSVLPPARRQGIGTALTLVPFADARARGYQVGVLGPTPEGQPMYRRLGFELFASPFVGYTLWREG